MALSPGSRLGIYEILAPIGAGGMGEVYRARDSRLGRDVAVKVLPKEVSGDPQRLARLEREARIVAGLNHPNIVTLFSVEEEDGVRFLTMELVEGQGLDRLVRSSGITVPLLLELAISMSEALAAAHARGVVHRDLKPGNVMVTDEGRVKVLDFGLAKVAAADEAWLAAARRASPELTVSADGDVAGTAPYMAPEQIRGEALDARTDIFALGVILYELAAGERPFQGATRADVYSSILRDPPPPLSRRRADLPPDLHRIVSRCLEKVIVERFPSARVLGDELRRVKRALDLGSLEAAPRPVRSDVASVAVLPFANRSQDEANEYFSDGLADEMIGMLSKIRGLRVAARTSSFRFKATTEDPAAIGRALRVATILDGSVRKAGNRVRISVQLVNAEDGEHLWSETYDRTLEDIFAVQDDIAQSVVKALRVALLGEEQNSGLRDEIEAEVARAAKGRSGNPEAYRLYLQGRHFHDRGAREDVTKAIGYLRQAVRLDPNFALAWAELGATYGTEAARGWVPVAEGYGRGRASVMRALSLEPGLAEGHARMGRIQISYDWDWRGAEASYRRALESAPGDCVVLGAAAVLAQVLGRFDEAIALARRAAEQDPLRSATYTILGLTLYAAGRLPEAEAAYRHARELAPQRVDLRGYLSVVLLAQGRVEEALAEAMQEPDEAYRLWALTMIHHAAGRERESRESRDSLTEKYATDCAFQIAEVHAVRGEIEGAFDWLHRAYAQRDGGLTEMMISPCLRPLHRDPRWVAFAARMGFDA